MEQAGTHSAQSAGAGRMVGVMGAVGLISSVLLVATFQITAPYVEANRAAALEEAIFEVLPGATQRAAFAPTADGGLVPADPQDKKGPRIYAGYDDGGALIGVAVEAQGQGFADVLRILYGYAPRCECVVGMKVLESKETPGLGDKIEKDPAFVANFDALDVRLSPDGDRLQNDVIMVKKGAKTSQWQVEAITGATISSRAIANIINQRSADIVPLIRRNLAILEADR